MQHDPVEIDTENISSFRSQQGQRNVYTAFPSVVFRPRNLVADAMRIVPEHGELFRALAGYVIYPGGKKRIMGVDLQLKVAGRYVAASRDKNLENLLSPEIGVVLFIGVEMLVRIIQAFEPGDQAAVADEQLNVGTGFAGRPVGGMEEDRLVEIGKNSLFQFN